MATNSADAQEQQTAPAFRYGAVTHWAQGKELDWVVDMGLGWVRTGVGWEWIEPNFTEPPTYHWEIADAIVSDCVARRLNILWGLPYTPKWASSNGEQSGYPKDDVARKHWRMFVHAVVERYIQQITYFEIWNEPNNAKFWQGSVDEFFNYILKPAAEEIKAVDPSKQVVAPTLMARADARISPDYFIRQLGKLGAANYIDVISQNVYEATPRDVIDQFEKGDFSCFWIACKQNYDAFFKLYDEAGMKDKPVWVTEFGWRTDKVGQKRQANYLADTLVRFSRRPRFIGAFIYELKDDDRFPPKWGLVKGDGTPKKSYWKLRNMLWQTLGVEGLMYDDDTFDDDGYGHMIFRDGNKTNIFTK